jgi:periplasmic divalent cation tolerance protein
MSADGYVLIMTSLDDAHQARQLARGLVEARLAACVQVGAVTSHYRWHGRVEEAQEHLLFVKTAAARAAAVEAFLRERHGYELPEVLSLPITGGSDRYLAWVDDSTAPE